MSSMKQLYTDYYTKLVRVLPMNDALFMAHLYSSQFLPGDAKESVAARTTRAEKASFFLDNYIEKGFEDDGSNPLFLELLKLMQRSDNLTLKSVANDIDSKRKQSTVLLVIITLFCGCDMYVYCEDMMHTDQFRCFCM